MVVINWLNQHRFAMCSHECIHIKDNDESTGSRAEYVRMKSEL